MAITHSNNVNSQVGKQLKPDTHTAANTTGLNNAKLKCKIPPKSFRNCLVTKSSIQVRRDIVRTSCLRRIRCHK